MLQLYVQYLLYPTNEILKDTTCLLMKKIPRNSQNNSIIEATLDNVIALLDAPQDLGKPSDLTSSKLEQNILFAVRRHQASLDWLIANYATGKVRPRIKKILWWALAEILYLDGAKTYSIVDVAVHFTKKRYSVSEAGFINAFLRKISDKLEIQDDLFQNAPAHIKLEIPPFLWERWTDQFGKETAERIANVILTPAPIVFRQPFDAKAAPPTVLLKPIAAPEWSPNARLFVLDGKIQSLGQFMQDNPSLYIQDPATLHAPQLLDPKPGETIADFCAAPGGKSRVIAELMQDTGTLLCLDRSQDKLDRLGQNLKMFKCVSVAQADATSTSLPENFLDAALLDVPCTNTGVLRRKPDAKWTFTQEKLDELVKLQKAILDATAPTIKHGGRIVYSTCSLEADENAIQVQNFLERHPDFSLVTQTQILPGELHDGAFAALLVKK